MNNNKCWNTAIYIRLSQDDKDTDNISNSVINQKKTIKQYIAKHDELIPYDVFIDDGYTGTNFNRPGFKRMMTDIHAGKVTCVIVKDLSRFGREYLSVGNYLEQVFPSLGIRFIAIMQNIDTYKQPKRMAGLEVPFLSLINEQYAIDISNKTRASLQAKQKAGKYVGTHTPYGYLRNPDDKNILIVDNSVSTHVENVFDMYINGHSMQDIAEHLNKQGILSPLGHFINIGVRKLTASMNKDTYKLWTGSKVHTILKNPIYTGDLIQGTTTSYSHKVKKRIPIPKENWIVTKNTHNPIITHSTFNLAQELLQKGTKPVSSLASPSLFSGMLTCADCGSQMVRNISIKNGTSYCNYLCSNYKKNGKANCTSHFISEDVIRAVVLDAIRLQIKAYGDMSALKQKVESAVLDKGNKENLENKVTALTGRIKSTDRLQKESENDFLSSVIDKQEFQYIQQRLNKQKKALDSQLNSIQREQAEQRHKFKNISDFISEFLKDGEVNQLTRCLVIHLIEEISIYQDKSIRIKFKFQNELNKLISEFDKTSDI